MGSCFADSYRVYGERVRNMDFESIEKDIEQLNKINPRANYTARSRYKQLYNSIYESLLEMEKEDAIDLTPGDKTLGYLRELLINDGPEYSYTFVFWEKGHEEKKYRIGVCIRGLPVCKPVEG